MELLLSIYFSLINHTEDQGANANVEVNRSSKNSSFGFLNHLPELKKKLSHVVNILGLVITPAMSLSSSVV